jgi:hypothetical protein
MALLLLLPDIAANIITAFYGQLQRIAILNIKGAALYAGFGHNIEPSVSTPSTSKIKVVISLSLFKKDSMLLISPIKIGCSIDRHYGFDWISLHLHFTCTTSTMICNPEVY